MDTLEQQALDPIGNPTEMAFSVPGAVDRISADPSYQAEFAAAFNDGVTATNLARALANFERTLLRGGSPVDRFRLSGDHAAMSAKQRQGFWLYESKGQCWRCHSGPNFTDEQFHNTGVSWGGPLADLGRFRATKNDDDRGKFKTPTLRGAGLRPPYMHDGSIQSLEDVVEFYNRGGKPNPNLSPHIRKLGLSQAEVEALVAFLKSL